MKKYKEYMDGVKASDTLHQRLTELEAPKARPAAWKRYGAVAAALVLVAGVGAWGLSRGGWDALTASFRPAADVTPENDIVDAPAIDIALVEPGDVAEPGVKTLGGYEVPQGGMVSYYLLPYIEYGTSGVQTQMALDWDVPPGSTKRDLTQADFAALFGREENLSVHLDWGGYELSGWAAWNEDGSFWGAFLNGYAGPLDHFEFDFIAGDRYPPTCIGYGDGVVNELWKVPVTAYAFDGEHGCDRRVEFLDGGYGYRFDLTSTDTEQAERLVSRLVRWTVVEGLEPDAITPDGAALAHPWEADPNYSVGEPNWNDGGVDMSVPAEEGGAVTQPYDPFAGGQPGEELPVPPDEAPVEPEVLEPDVDPIAD